MYEFVISKNAFCHFLYLKKNAIARIMRVMTIKRAPAKHLVYKLQP